LRVEFFGAELLPRDLHVDFARDRLRHLDTAGARKAYQDFFNIWQDADPDVPILVEALKNYAALH
jgi:hypothetical protein